MPRKRGSLKQSNFAFLPVVRPDSHAAAASGDCSGGLTIAVTGFLGGGEGAAAAGGGGHINSPSFNTIEPRTTSSSRSMANSPLPPMERRNFVRLLAYRVLDCVGKRLGRSV